MMQGEYERDRGMRGRDDLTVQEVADRFGVTRITVYGWIKAGYVRAYRLPGHKTIYRVPASELDRITSTFVEVAGE